MIRLRKYRIFVFVSVIVIFAVYYYGQDTDWESSYSLDQLRDYGSRLTGQGSWPSEEDSLGLQDIHSPEEDDQFQLQDETGKAIDSVKTDAKEATWNAVPVKGSLSSSTTSTSSSSSSSSSSSTSSSQRLPAFPTQAKAGAGIVPTPIEAPPASATSQFVEAGRGRLEVSSKLQWDGHWVKPTSQYPIPSESLIQLPTGIPKRIPTIQFEFTEETAAIQADRESKLAAVKNAMTRTWSAYRKHAWMHDELRPVAAGRSDATAQRSASFRDPFGGWAATLVDSLDTLWIMGMQDEFDDAVNATSTIDFTKCARADIPLFETTIRYLGGLLGAYDISGQRYSILRDKAVELAEVLMGAFDTPNHMPMTYYQWTPAQAALAHEAGSGVVMAELGSLSVEFTRLAQITKQPKYFDAIARITNEFEKYQNNTMLPGLWPTFIDASSGCDAATVAKLSNPTVPEELSDNPVATSGTQSSKNLLDEAVQSSGPAAIAASEEVPDQRKDSSSFGNDGLDLSKEPHESATTKYPQKDSSSFGADSEVGAPGGINKRQFAPTAAEIQSESLATPEECTPLGFRESKHVFKGKYTLGGMADSTYEYLPKEYLLLGGFSEQYKSMYLSMMETVREYLLYRPMVKDDVDILFTGSFTPLSLNNETGRMNGWFEADSGHLSCFVGGMFGLGARIFDRPEDLETAIKLTDACVWAYGSTVTGIAPEDITPVVCEDMTSCPWNETKWLSAATEEGLKTDYLLINALKAFDVDEEEPAATPGILLEASEDLESTTQSIPQTFSLSAGIDKYVVPNAKAVEQDLPSMTTTDLETDETVPVPGTPLAPVSGQLGSLTKHKRQFDDIATDPLELTSTESVETEEDTLPFGQTTTNDVLDSVAEDAEDTISPLAADTITTGQLREASANVGGLEDAAVPPIGSAAALNAFGTTATATEDVDIVTDDIEDAAPTAYATREEVMRNYVNRTGIWPGIAAIKHRKYILRPEAIESVFYMYRITGDESWRAKGWKMFQAIEKATRTDIAYSAISDVTVKNPPAQDEMESFWTAETLKYFYLLFSLPNVVSLDEYVLNTEAHPFLRPDAQAAEVKFAKVEALKTIEEDYSQPHRQEPDIFGVPHDVRA